MNNTLERLLKTHQEQLRNLNPNSREWAKEYRIVKQLHNTLQLLEEALATPKTPAETEAEQTYPTQYWEGMEPSAKNPRGLLKELTMTSLDLQEAYEKGRTHAPTQGEIDTATKVILTELHHMGIECLGQEKAQDIAYQTLNTVRNYMNGDRQ